MMKSGKHLQRLASLATLAAVVTLLWVIIALCREGLMHWHWWVLWRRPRELRAGGGLGPELINTLSMVALAECLSLPLGLATAIWLGDAKLPRRVRDGLDGFFISFQSIPAIVVGLVAFEVLVGYFHWPLSVATGTLALAVLNVPQVVVFSRQAMAAVPDAWREGSLALGATALETVWRMVLPASLLALVDQLGLSFARLAGESALLIFTAGLNVGPHWGWFQPGETLAVRLWQVRTEGLMPDRAALAAETGMVLLAITALALVGSKVWSLRLKAYQSGPGGGGP